jgi:hypothetical protein
MNYLSRTSLIAGLLTLAACGDDLNAPVETDPGLREAVVAMGFRPDMIVDRGDYFLVEGDIKIAKAGLRAPRRIDGLSLQWRTNNLVSAANVSNIVVNLSGLEASWQTAVQQAISEWNSVTPGAIVGFSEGSPGEITMTMTDDLLFLNCNTGVIAQASFPSGDQPGTTIEVSSDFTNCLSASQKKFNMAHELGHTIGFRHTNWRTNDCENPPCQPGPDGAHQIAGTPATDGGSVMNGSVGLSPWSGFSHYDQVAAFELYHTSVVATESNSGGFPLVSWTAAPGATGTYVILVTQEREVNDWYQWIETGYYEEHSWVSSPATSFLDSAHPYTGWDRCENPSFPHQTRITHWTVEVHYPRGVARGGFAWAHVVDPSSWPCA